MRGLGGKLIALLLVVLRLLVGIQSVVTGVAMILAQVSLREETCVDAAMILAVFPECCITEYNYLSSIQSVFSHATIKQFDTNWKLDERQ